MTGKIIAFRSFFACDVGCLYWDNYLRSCMKDPDFKAGIALRFKLLVSALMNRGMVADTKELCEIMDTVPQSISDWQLGKRMPTLAHIDLLTKSLKVNPQWLISGIEPMFVEAEKDSEDMIVMITRAMGTGLIDAAKGEKLIAYIRYLQTEIKDRDEEIIKLNTEIVELLRLGFSKG